MNELLLFHAGNRQFGVALPLVRSIQGAKSLFEEPADGEHEPSDAGQKRNFCTPPPRCSHSYVRIPEAEFPVPIYDLSAILGDGLPSESSENKKVMFVSVRDHSIALKVDRVERVISVEKDRIESLSPVFRGYALNWFPRVLKQNDSLILLLNPGGILGIEEEYQADEDDLSQTEDIPDNEALQVPDDESLAVSEESEADWSALRGEEAEQIPVESLRTEEFQPEDLIYPEIPDPEIPSLSEVFETERPDISPKPEFPTDPEKLESLLSHIVKQEIMSEMILSILTPYMEEAVEQEIGMVKKIWRNNLKKKRKEKRERTG